MLACDDERVREDTCCTLRVRVRLPGCTKEDNDDRETGKLWKGINLRSHIKSFQADGKRTPICIHIVGCPTSFSYFGCTNDGSSLKSSDR